MDPHDEVYAHSPPPGRDDWHPLDQHLRAVAELAATYAEPFGLAEAARLAGFWHDLGKATRGFQEYLRTNRGRVQHRNGGAIAALELLGRHRLALPIALAIAGHHAGLPAWRGPGQLKEILGDHDQRLAHPEWQAVCHRLAAPALSEPPFERVLQSLPQDDHHLAWELAVRFLFSALVDADWTDTACYYGKPGIPVPPTSVLADLNHRLDAYLDAWRVDDTQVNRQRRMVLEACRAAAVQAPGIFTLTVPTGGGKTLAGLSFALRHAVAHGLRRVVIVLPFTTIIEQNAQRIRAILGDEHILEHHSALDWEGETREGDDDDAWKTWKQRAETWNVPIVITTAVQFLETLHSDRPGRVRKLHRLARSVVILDEAQALPSHLLEPTLDTLRVLSRAFGTSLVCCTATQPAVAPIRVDGRPFQRLGECITPIIPDPRPLFSALRRVTVEWPADCDQALPWESLAERLTGEHRVLVVVHRRQDARDLAMRLGADWHHLSAAMCPAHRLDALDRIRAALAEPATPCRVVATQLVEAGVDLDFPAVYRALAGLDSLAQAAGRCNREGLLAEGRVVFFRAPTDPPRGLQAALNVTLGMLRRPNRPDLDDPFTFPAFFAELAHATTADARNLGQHRQGVMTDFPELAKGYRVIDNDQQIAVIVPWSGLETPVQDAIEHARHGHADEHAYRRLQRASVSLPRRRVAELVAASQVQHQAELRLCILNDVGLYHPRFGLDGTDPGPGDLVL